MLDIFKAGADGILLGGCHIGDCHYISGNYYTEKRVNLMKKLLKECGVAPERDSDSNGCPHQRERSSRRS